MGALTFDEETHRYFLDGIELPSVTKILEPYTGLDYVDRATLDAAARLGSQVHKAVHLFNVGRLASCPDHVEPYLQGWKRFLGESGAVVLQSEVRVHSAKYRFAGTFDSLLDWKDSEWLIDVKSGSVVPRTVGPQTAAYASCYEEQHGVRIRKRACVHLRPNGTYKVVTLTKTTDWAVFLSALNLHRWYKGEL